MPPLLKDTPAVLDALAESERERRIAEAREARSIARALILFALFAMAALAFRAGAERLFYANWWRQW